MSKSILYAANTNSQIVQANNVINFGNIVRKYGCNCSISGGNAELDGPGYYDIETNLTVKPGSSGTLTISLFKDGVAIPGANASITATANELYAISIPAVVRQYCGCLSTITAVVSSAVTVQNASIIVDKL